MKRPPYKPLKDTVREAELFRRRAFVGFALILLCLLLVAGRFLYLQVLQHEEFTTRAEANRVKLRALPPNRGLIYDRNGRLLADNRPAYRLEMIPEQVEDLDATLRELGRIVMIDADDLERFHELRSARRSFQAVPIRFRMSEAEVARFAVNRHRFAGVDIVPYQTRVYPHGPELAHVLGYVGRIGPDDLEALDASDYAATSHIGKTGIERYYEALLHGKVGHERVETDAQGRVLRVLERQPPEVGRDLVLTLDADLQRAALAALDGRAGSIVAVDPRNGEVLALVSAPSFDPNLFVNGISNADYRALLASPGRPLFNRALQGGYEPGSTLKPYVALAGLELGVIPSGHTVVSHGWFQLPGQSRRYHDWKVGGHGRVDVVEAIAQSVNTFFYQLAIELGIDRMHDYLAQFGFGRETGLDLHGEAGGILPSQAWKRETRGAPWYPGETVIAGIGQGYMVATPLQLAQAAAILAARGQAHQLHLLQQPAAQSPAARRAPAAVPVADWQHWQQVIDGMESVLHGRLGTARAVMADRPGFRMAGKTGTAQVYGRTEGEAARSVDELPEHLRHHALFIGFAPVESPRIVIAVVVEHGGSGASVAAPVARQVIEYYLTHAAET